MTTLRPVPAVAAMQPYAPRRHPAPIDLDLSGTEAGNPPLDLTGFEPASAGKYPDSSPLRAWLAASLAVAPDRVLVTAGADDALDRAFRAMVGPGREVVLTTPTFEMLPRYAQLSGASVMTVGWPGGPFPLHEVIGALSPRTALIVVVSPNNPTGAVAALEDLRTIAGAASAALLVVDLAYVEFADHDPTRQLLEIPNAVVTRTFSKAWGLPGLRVGWAAGPRDVIGWMRNAGSPYAVSAASLDLVTTAAKRGTARPAALVAGVRSRREQLTGLLATLGLGPLPSQANFVCVPASAWLHDALAGFGIAVRHFRHADADRIRITCPSTPESAWRLSHALWTIREPEALLFDLDGVLADVSRSYRRTIIATGARFGVTIAPDDIRALKARGNANDDWRVTWDLLAARGVDVPLAEVTEAFEELYQGVGERPGLRQAETLLVSADWLASLARRLPIGIVTGRPAADAHRFLDRWKVRGLMSCCITRDDGPAKPDPFAVEEAMKRLGVSRAWLVGDTPDDIRAAREAGVLPIGVVAPGDPPDAARDVMLRAGASRVLGQLDQLEDLLP